MPSQQWLNKVNKKRTLCEVAREIHDETVVLEKAGVSKGDVETIRRLAREIVRIGKKINRRLYEISRTDNREWWDANHNYEKSLRRRLGYPINETFDEGQEGPNQNA